MADIFISHVEEDASLAIDIVEAIEHRGFSAWYYERDTVPGRSYLLQIGEEIDACKAVMLLISSYSLSSHQVTQEVIQAYEKKKPVIPLLVDISHAEFQARQPEWRAALGATASIRIPQEGVNRIIRQITKGLSTLAIEPAEHTTGTACGGLAPASRPPDAERRQLTILFCDLVASTALATQLDPEDLREVIRAYHATCAAVIQRFDGHIAQYLGDGVLVYYGYPQAHEDGTHRAVRTGLGMVEGMDPLNARLEQTYGIRLAVRIGIHTGLVVVGDMGGSGREEQLALGATPNIAAHLQGLATPNTVVISEVSYQLVQGYFVCEPLGKHPLRDVSDPLTVYHVLGESGATSRLEVAQPRGLTPLVGREPEVGLLRERWQRVQAGMGQVVLLSGEAGIGKSRLVHVLKDDLAPTHHTRLECRGSPYYQHTALYPVTELFQRLLRWQPEDTPIKKLDKLETTLSQYPLALAEVVPLLASLLALALPADRYPSLPLTPQRQRQKTLETLLAILHVEAARQPVLFIVEDLHWVDPTTLELLTLLIDQGPTVPILTVLTCRPEFHPPWGSRAHITPMSLPRLSPPEVQTMVARLTGEKPLPVELLQQLLANTDGVPLFIEELTKTVLESGLLRVAHDHYELTRPLPPLAIPSSLHDALMARLDRLAAVKSVAQLGATLGRQFPYALLRAVAPLDETVLQHALGQLVHAELLYQRGVPPQATYLFKHALIQDAAYQSLLKSTRQQLHRKVAWVLEEQFPARAEAEPEVVARHYEEAGLADLAVPYYRRAGEQAAARSAHQEAIVHLRKAIALLTTLPESTARNTREVSLQLALGPSLMAARGYALPETQAVWERARVLCDDVGDVSQLASALVSLSVYCSTGGAFARGVELAKRVLENARETGEEQHVLSAHVGVAFAEYFQGKFTSALQHCEQGIASYDPSQHGPLASPIGTDPGVAARTFAGTSLWQLGYPDKALKRAREAVTLARTRAHPFSLAFALSWEAIVHCFRRDLAAMRDTAAEVIPLSEAQGFPLWLGLGRVLQWAALAISAADATAITEFMQGMTLAASTGNRSGGPFLLGLLAEVHATAGNQPEALRAVAMGLAEAEQTGQHSWDAELHRLQGQLTLQYPTPSTQAEVEAEHLFRRALEIARHQDARSHELRASTSLARLWQQQGKQADARALLAPIYGWFTEGFDTADLQKARALLEELA